MLQILESTVQDWDNVDDECQHVPLNCPWTITSKDKSWTVIIMCLEWTFNYDFWKRLTARTQGDPNTSKQRKSSEHDFLHKLRPEALYK